MSEKNTEKETRKIVSEDVEKFFRDVWGKVVEYASLGAEEATKLSSTAKVRVDIETLKFKKGKIVKMLGERYLELCEKTPSCALPGTKEVLKTLQGLDKEITALEKELLKTKKAEKKKPAEKVPVKTSAKTPAKASAKAPARKKSPAKKTAPKKTAPRESAREKSPTTGGILAPSKPGKKAKTEK